MVADVTDADREREIRDIYDGIADLLAKLDRTFAEQRDAALQRGFTAGLTAGHANDATPEKVSFWTAVATATADESPAAPEPAVIALPDIDNTQLTRIMEAIIDGLVPRERGAEAWAIAIGVEHHFTAEARRQYVAGYIDGKRRAFFLMSPAQDAGTRDAAMTEALRTFNPKQTH